MMLKIRPFTKTDENYEAITAVWNLAWPEYLETVPEVKAGDERRNPKHYWHRLIVEVENEVVGFSDYGETWWTNEPGQYFIGFTLHPDYIGQGISTAVYNHVVDILKAKGDLHALVADTRENRTAAWNFLQKRGFEPVMRYPISHLYVSEFDPAPFAGILEQVEDAGIELCTLGELQQRDPDCMTKLWDAHWEIVQDVPSPDEHVRRPFADFLKRYEGPNFIPEANFVAVDNGQYVGVSELWSSLADKKKLYTGLTGVVRSHRRKRIATALKLRAIQFAQQYGAEIVQTDNEENNPMFQLNLQLGFKPQPAMVDFKKTFSQNGHKK